MKLLTTILLALFIMGTTNGLSLTSAKVKSAGDIWVPISTDFGWPDPPIIDHTAVWTGTEMSVTGEWLGTTVTLYNPTTDTWTIDLVTSTPPVDCPRNDHSAVWTGTEEIDWGGWGEHQAVEAYGTFNDGVRFNPSSTTWTPIVGDGDRYGHTAVWTGTEMIVWGGYMRPLGSVQLIERGDGARYDPSTDTWTWVSDIGAPSARVYHTAVWTGTKMIIWGGADGPTHFADGFRYDPSTDTWTPISTTNAPCGRIQHAAIWTGTKMIIWGGNIGGYNRLNDGAMYNPSTDTWTPISNVNAPSPRDHYTAVWTGKEMIIWGGFGMTPQGLWGDLGDGARYNPTTDTWTPLSTLNNPSPRSSHTAVWTGTEMIIWGGGLFKGYCWYPAAEAATNLIDTVEGMGLTKQLENHLVRKLTAAIQFFKAENLKSAERSIGDFYEKVQLERGNRLTNEQAETLSNECMEIWVRTLRALRG